MLIAGYFNCVINAKDDFRQSLERVITQLELKDAWEQKHKNEIKYTFIRGKSASKLDRFYVDSIVSEQGASRGLVVRTWVIANPSSGFDSNVGWLQSTSYSAIRNWYIYSIFCK